MLLRIGIDEAGRGPWAGPVVACAVSFAPHFSDEIRDRLADSKSLTPQQRQELFSLLVSASTGHAPQIFFGIGEVSAFEIDTLGIKQATRTAMHRALTELLRRAGTRATVDCVLIDGNDHFAFPDILTKKPVSIIRGDQKIPEIQAASILAKVHRDTLLTVYDSLYPEYGFGQHKGYGTLQHRKSLVKPQDVLWLHRQSYKPVASVLHKKPRLLLHVCCGPDATVPILDLKEQYEIIAFWYNPNIHPKTEYEKRKQVLIDVCDREGIQWFEWAYDTENFFASIAGYEHLPEQTEKCYRCYDMRMRCAAEQALAYKCDFWTTTLLISPHKTVIELIKHGAQLEQEVGVCFLPAEFRKKWGFERSVEYTKKHNLYRQNYCGCIYSDTYPTKGKKTQKKGSFSW